MSTPPCACGGRLFGDPQFGGILLAEEFGGLLFGSGIRFGEEFGLLCGMLGETFGGRRFGIGIPILGGIGLAGIRFGGIGFAGIRLGGIGLAGIRFGGIGLAGIRFGVLGSD
ncbi:hypothetical protein [Brevibacillus nitrificans]|uniref:hypothetical protein n=1 Tax=Brevibacillus nitrificans TaxID=651560 RepID=UPI0011CEC5A1|nr:hypothetical protein [Brevibacillus nitrificans]